MENLYLIVGLGNPGRAYARTRHNAGFMVVERLARRWNADWKRERKFSTRLAKAQAEGSRLLLCQPGTFMNASGEAIGALARFHKIAPERMLVTVDDADLPLGEVRLRARGSSGGHHGLESIERHLATRDFPRQRIGIGRADGAREITDYVLAPFGRDEASVLKNVLTRACDQIECWLRAGILAAMNQFNGKTKAIE